MNTFALFTSLTLALCIGVDGLRTVVSDRDPRAAAVTWLPNPLGDYSGPVWATVAGKDKRVYVNSAIMLAGSIREHGNRSNRTYPMVCIVHPAMSKENQELLKNASWNLVYDADPLEHHQTRGEGMQDFDKAELEFWKDEYAKFDVFRLPYETVVFLDADTYIMSDEIMDLFELADLKAEDGPKIEKWKIGMAPSRRISQKKDGYNSGVMVLHPDLEKCKDLRTYSSTQWGWLGLDQPVINHYFGERHAIIELPQEFNIHSQAKCNGKVVVAHFTGPLKPAFMGGARLDSDPRNNPLNQNGPAYHVQKGGESYVHCDNLYQKYFCDMKRKYAGQFDTMMNEEIDYIYICETYNEVYKHTRDFVDQKHGNDKV